MFDAGECCVGSANLRQGVLLAHHLMYDFAPDNQESVFFKCKLSAQMVQCQIATVLLQVQLMETKFKELAADEDERVKRNVQQAQEKQEMDAAEQQVQRAEEWAATCRSRDQQLAFKASCKKQALCEENDFVKAWQVWLWLHLLRKQLR
jgi:hypothetical protein